MISIERKDKEGKTTTKQKEIVERNRNTPGMSEEDTQKNKCNESYKKTKMKTELEKKKWGKETSKKVKTPRRTCK